MNPACASAPVPKTGLSRVTFARLKRLNASATKSRRAVLPTGKYFRTRKSVFISSGLLKELRPNPKGRAETGKAPLRFESRPVSGLTGRPLSIRENRGHLDVPENPRDPVVLGGLAGFFVADGQFPKCIEHEPVLLVLPRQSPVGSQV